MRILYLSRNMAGYTGSMYQRDVMEEISRQAEVDFYGPGFSDFDPTLDIKEVVSRKGGDFDWIIVGHAWLSDRPGEDVDPVPNLRLEDTSIPKAVILNKEYTNLEDKLEWILQKGFVQAFTHHHDTKRYAEHTKTPFEFLPFGFNHHLFTTKEATDKDIDFSFSGLLQNQGKFAGQSDTRVRIMAHFYYCLGDVPIIKRKQFRHLNLFWNAIPRYRWQRRPAMLLRRYRFLPDPEYRNLQLRSKIYLNTLSPANLVSPRFSENMACRALVFCEESEHYERIFPEDCFVTFRSDLSDFDEKMTFYLESEYNRQSIVDRAHALVFKQHTWHHRVKHLIRTLQK